MKGRNSRVEEYPSSFESSRWADLYGCIPGHSVKLADAIQATPKLISRDRLVGSSYRQMRGQMMLMFQSIIDLWYDFAKLCTGSPDAGTMWEKHCDT